MALRSSSICASRATGRTASERAVSGRCLFAIHLDGARVAERQIERECAPLSMDAAKLDLASQQHRQFAAYGETQASAPVLSGRSRVGLLEGFEYQPLFFRSDPNAGVLNRKGENLFRGVQHRVIGSPAVRRAVDADVDMALAGELDRIGQKVLQDLLKALRVAGHAAGQIIREPDVEGKVLQLGHMPKVAIDRFAKTDERDFLDVDGDGTESIFERSRMSLMRLQKIGAGGVDVARKLDLLLGEIACCVLSELLAKDEDRVERRAQLMRHIRQELGLVFRGERQLRGFLLECVSCLFNLGVLALDLGILLGEQLRLGAELLVGVLKLRLGAPATRR